MKSIKLSAKKDYNPNILIHNLHDLGYERVDVVFSSGAFSVRGDIIDIFIQSHTLPVRIEFDDDTIERLSFFNPHNQRSQSSVDHIDIVPIDENQAANWNPHSPSGTLLTSIQIGDFVVHEDYGVGRYEGLVTKTILDREGEFLWIQYKGEDRVYVPIEQTHLVHAYIGSGKEPVVHGLYDGRWQRTRERARKSAETYAHELYELYQNRQETRGKSCEPDTDFQSEFAAMFPFKETADQEKAIQEIKSDMESDRIMDRLLCGDVGYGKTEVLLRAAFKALENNSQVAILVPTTLLAEQHHDTFRARLDPFPYRVGVLSRFQTKAEQSKVVKALKSGSVDVVIGTHRLLQNDVGFSDLGLLIIDEEQRFGVSHKETLKQLRQHVDVLSVSATPIPRTLYMALTGARDLSCIETPPKQRKPVVTRVLNYNDEQVQDAIAYELSRKGQVFYLHNRVKTIDSVGARIQGWFPNANVAVAHGQMSEDALQQVMMEFWAGDLDILVCTTIIENGIDVPRANTLIMDSAEMYGVAQIHQLRGRVGRTSIQGYAYLFYTNERKLTDKAKQRLSAIKSYTSLGAGYQLALKDLEIRGAGTLLGHKQHGNMMAVGFDLYCKLLNRAVKTLKKEPYRDPPAISFSSKIKAYIPHTYVPTDQERLTLYKRLMVFTHAYQVDELVEELEDRYGALPKLVEMLLMSIRGQLYESD